MCFLDSTTVPNPDSQVISQVIREAIKIFFEFNVPLLF